MTRLTFVTTVTALFVLAAVACAAPAVSPPPSATTAAPLQAPPSAAPSPGPASGASGQGNANADRVNGVIQRIADGKATLEDGKSFSMTTATRLILTTTKTAADLRPGQYVAVTATLGADGVLLASMVNIFGDTFRSALAGQRPLSGGALMTNATIDKVEGTAFTVNFPGGGAQVKLAPDAQVGGIDAISQDDLKPGESVSTVVVDGVAQSVSVR